MGTLWCSLTQPFLINYFKNVLILDEKYKKLLKINNFFFKKIKIYILN